MQENWPHGQEETGGCSMNVIELNNLTKSYGSARGIEDVTLHIEEGEIFGFIGPNGAGKSTTIRTMLAFIYPNRGSARIFGKDCLKQSAEIKQHIGYLPAEGHFYDDMKVKDFLFYSAKFYRKDCSRRIYELSDRFSLDLNKKVNALSSGNRKKVGIVQALLHEPKLLILDEPTGGLDPLMQNVFFEVMQEENKKGTTILFSSHILSEVQRLCHRVAVIKDGRVTRIEEIEKLRANYYKKVRIAFRALQNGFQLQLPGIKELKVKKKCFHRDSRFPKFSFRW